MPLDPNAYPRVDLGSVAAVVVAEQKIRGQLKDYYSAGTGSNESPGAMGNSGQVEL